MKTATRKNVTRKDADKVLDALRQAFPGYLYEYDDEGNRLGLDLKADQPQVFEPGFHADTWVIAWEGGPYEWTYSFPFGGVDAEMAAYGAGKIHDVSASIPNHLFIEPLNHWAVSLWLA